MKLTSLLPLFPILFLPISITATPIFPVPYPINSSLAPSPTAKEAISIASIRSNSFNPDTDLTNDLGGGGGCVDDGEGHDCKDSKVIGEINAKVMMRADGVFDTLVYWSSANDGGELDRAAKLGAVGEGYRKRDDGDENDDDPDEREGDGDDSIDNDSDQDPLYTTVPFDNKINTITAKTTMSTITKRGGPDPHLTTAASVSEFTGTGDGNMPSLTMCWVTSSTRV